MRAINREAQFKSWLLSSPRTSGIDPTSIRGLLLKECWVAACRATRFSPTEPIKYELKGCQCSTPSTIGDRCTNCGGVFYRRT